MAVLTGRVAVVTGASMGIGAGLAGMLAAEGAQVVLAARGAAGLEQVAKGIRRDGGAAIPVVTDLTNDDSLASLLARTRAELGPVDVLVNNAGYAVWKPLEATTMAEWDRTFAVNVRAAAWLCAAVLPGMQARGFGRIINIGSEAGVAIVPGLAAYCVSKHALRALTEVIQDANHDNGIKAWVICPGFVDTDMGYVIPGANPASFLKVDEVVDVVRFLLHTGDNVKVGPEILVRTMRNPMTSRGETAVTGIAELHAQALDATGRIVDGVPAGRWHAATPCGDWDARVLVNHLVSGNWWAAELAAGRTIEELGSRLDGDLLGDDPAAAYADSAAAAAAAFRRPGALDAPCAVSYGPVPGSVYAGHRFLDVLVHGWDLAVATGQDYTLDPDLMEACRQVIEPQLEAFRSAGALGPEVAVPAGASAQALFLALLGRNG